MNAALATTISVTRQAPESVGTAYKTILARMTTISAGGTDEDGATLTSYTEDMNTFGINVLDATGHLRQMAFDFADSFRQGLDLATQQLRRLPERGILNSNFGKFGRQI